MSGSLLVGGGIDIPKREVTAEEFGIETHGWTRVRAYPTGFSRRLDWRKRWNWQLLTPTLARGTCLDPWIQDGDILWHDSELPPFDRDLVVCELTYRRLSREDGTLVKLTAVKQFRDLGHECSLVCKQGAVDAKKATILGVVVAWRRPGWWKRPSMRSMRLPFQLGGVRWLRKSRDA